MTAEYRIYPYGDVALIVETTQEISEESYRRIRCLSMLLKSEGPDAVRELIPAYCSLLVVYDPLEADYAEMEATVRAFAERAETVAPTERQVVRVPVCYEGNFAPDIQDVARHAGLSPEEIVNLHSSGTYLIYMLGFTPGFPYLGGMTERIAAPRKSSPRVKIPAGSVGIAGSQTGIYPQESPGGWNIIGRTPAVLFDPVREPPALFRAGQYIRFYPIDSRQYETLEREAARGAWMPETEYIAGDSK